MKKFNFTILVGLLIQSLRLFGQENNVGIGTSKPDQSAVLELNSNNKGLLIPRMSLLQRNSVISPAQGLLIYQTDEISGFYFYEGNSWKSLNEKKSLAASGISWDTEGNGLLSGSPTEAKIGYDNDIPFKIIVNSFQAGLIDKNKGLSFYGFMAGRDNLTGRNNTAIGKNALRGNLSGSGNVAIGGDALTTSSSGDNNFALGNGALTNANGAMSNVAIGTDALNNTQSGQYNTGIGFRSNFLNNSGSHNVGIGYGALYSSSTSSANTAIGNFALHNGNVSGRNTAIGFEAGYNCVGNYNVFLGNGAGYSENGSEKLYISNSNTANPLIKGDFQANNLQINSKTTGYLAIGDFTTAAAASPGTGGIPLPANIGQAGGYRLVVQDGILCEKVKVALRSNTGADWADYVFEPEYKANMMTLEEVEKFTLENKHLPNVLSAKQMVEEGLDVAKTSKIFMEKIEELTLYMIELNKEVKALKAENAALKGNK